MKVRKAVIPAAGRGVRMRPLAGHLPKEMLPVGSRPMVAHCVEEALLSGIEEICVIVGSDKGPVREYLLREKRLSEVRSGDGDIPSSLLAKCRLLFKEQPEPTGIAHALALAEEFVGGEPFAYMLPDELFLGSEPALKQVLTSAGSSAYTLGIRQVSWEEAFAHVHCGLMEVAPVRGRLFRIVRLLDKRAEPLKLSPNEVVWKGFPRALVLPGFFRYLHALQPPEGVEYDDVPIWQAIVREEGLMSVWLEGKGFDLGHPDGYRAALAYLEQFRKTEGSAATYPS